MSETTLRSSWRAIGIRVAALVAAVGLLGAACGGAEAGIDEADGQPPASDVPTGTADEAIAGETPTTTTPPTTTTTRPPEVDSGLPLLPTTTTTVIDRSIDPPPPVAAPEGPPGRNSVFVLGDSVFLGTARAIPLALSHWLVTYDAVGNRRLAQGIDVLAERRDEIGEAVVIQLGNNYIPGERGDYASQIDEAMRALEGVPRVVWVTVAEVSDTRREINQAIRDAESRWPNLRVADWASVVASDPALSWDGIHLTPAGRQAMAQLIAETLGPVVLP